ncbi:MAG: prepilin peptidase [Candidatus Verstraetearchaeota archaeon]|jgi:preflagellin peptidase FlaK|nr:prepilin peptidase [Candidatus Verstraetearchaeota archaeon]
MISLIKTLVISIGLLIASIQDIKSREIDDKIWIILIPIGIFLTILEIITNKNYPYTIVIFSIITSIVLSLIIYYLHLYGGADAKALITIALFFPIPPYGIEGTLIIFPIIVFGNSLMATMIFLIFYIIIAIIWNSYLAIKGIKLFKDIEANIWKKIFAFIFGFKLSSKIANSIHFNPIERICNGKRRIVISYKVEDKKVVIEGDYIWATLTLPFILFIFIGFILYFIYGDLLFRIITLLLRV